MNVTNGMSVHARQEDQRIALKQLRNLVQDVLLPCHDDNFLIKWLKARDFDIDKAEKMLRESLKFRKKVGADQILTSAYELPEVFRKNQVSEYLGFDKENNAVRVFMAGICDYKGFVYSLRVIDLMKIVIYIFEHDLKIIKEKNKKVGKTDEKMTFIFDFQGFNLKQFYDRAVINAGVQIITMYQDNYPEALKTVYLINVPSYFNWIFNLFKPFLNAVTLSKIKIYRNDDWKKEFIQKIEPKVLPAFLGGERTDPDGNPRCTSLICWNAKISPEYYRKQKRIESDDPTMQSVTIQQRSHFEVSKTIETPGSLIKWLFQTKDYNIRFGVFFKRGKRRCDVLIPVQSVDCQVVPEQGELLCENSGHYVLHFDNSYSWLTAKQLLYKVEVEEPDPSQFNNN